MHAFVNRDTSQLLVECSVIKSKDQTPINKQTILDNTHTKGRKMYLNKHTLYIILNLVVMEYTKGRYVMH